MEEIASIRNSMLEILNTIFEGSNNVTATQQMGVSLTNAVKRDGVVIIQNQNVEVLSKIGPSVINVIKICDSLSTKQSEPIQIEMTEVETPTGDPIENCCDYMFSMKMGWKEMQRTINERYLEYVMARHKTKAASATFLGIGPTYLSKMT